MLSWNRNYEIKDGVRVIQVRDITDTKYSLLAFDKRKVVYDEEGDKIIMTSNEGRENSMGWTRGARDLSAASGETIYKI